MSNVAQLSPANEVHLDQLIASVSSGVHAALDDMADEALSFLVKSAYFELAADRHILLAA